MCIDFITPAGRIMTLIIFVLALFAASIANAVPTNSPFPQRYNFPSSPDLERNSGLQQPSMSSAKIGRIIEGNNLIWGESIGWVNLKTAHAELKIGSNILAGWVWLENCGWVCVGDGSPLDGKRYSNSGTHDFGVNNDGHGKLSGFAWSEVTGWINFQTSHSRVYLDARGQFYGYAWGENVGWMHFGPGRTVQYLAKADPGPWREIGDESRSRLASGPDDSEICSGSFPVAGLRNNSERYNKYAATVCFFSLRGDDFCAHTRHRETPVYISGLSRLYSIRAPPVGI